MVWFKALGVGLVSCFKNTNDDVFQCRRTNHIVKPSAEGQSDHNGLPRKILITPTRLCPKVVVTSRIRRLVREVLTRNRSVMFTEEQMNESAKEYSRAPCSGGIGLSVSMASILIGHRASMLNVWSMVFDEAKLDDDSRSWLYSCGFGCCDTALFASMYKMG